MDLDQDIEDLNLDVAEQHKLHDVELYNRNDAETGRRIEMIAQRTRLLRKVQKQHAQIVELTTLLELQRLRTYPTLSTSQY